MSNLPSGQVTFLMTDIEGSTVLWDQYPEAMREAIRCHDEIITRAVVSHHGVLIKNRGEGDSVFTVFSDPGNAVRTAFQIQTDLEQANWGFPEVLRVRIAIHTGEADLRGDDYFGSTVNRCARLRAIAHGGQTLLSAYASTLTRDSLPAELSLKDLGHHRLRDLTEPEHVFELRYSGLRDDFPPLRSLDQHRHNLPLQPVSLVGRERELADIRDMLLSPDVRLITLTGPGGIGKTRLGLQAAADLSDHFDDGVFFVGLAAISDPSLVFPAIAQSLRISEVSGRSFQDLVADYLRDKNVLLIMDNFEQLLPAAGDIAGLLQTSPRLKLLVTSRSVLHVSGEHVFPVPTLQVPPASGQIDLVHLAEYEAIRMFVERARAARPDFTLTAENANAVRSITRHLEGLPLAIELAAARVRMLSPQALVRRLSRALPLLTGGARDVPTRQQTLRSAILWSYDLLAPPERALFRRMSVFVGGSTLDAIERVTGTEDLTELTAQYSPDELTIDIIDGISTLLDASLVEQREMDDGEPRFRMLEVVREFGREQLESHGESEPMSGRHAAYYLDMAEAAEPHLQGPEQVSWFNRLQSDHDNLRAALRWYRDRNDSEHFLRLAGALFWFWFGHGYRTEALDWYEAAFASSPDRTRWRAKALYGAGILSRAHGSHEDSRAWLQESLSIAREQNDLRLAARALHMLGGNEASVGHPAAARKVLEESMEIARSIDDGWTIAVVMRELGALATQDGDVETARRYLEESVRIHRQRGERWAQAHSQNALGDLMRSLALYDQAEESYEESLRVFELLGTKDGRPSVLHNMAYVALNQGDTRRAAALFLDALKLFLDMGDRKGVAECLAGLAGVLGTGGQHRKAAWLFGVSQALLDDLGTQISASNITDYGRNLVSVSLAMDDNEYSEAYESGRAALIEQAIAEVLQIEPSTLSVAADEA